MKDIEDKLDTKYKGMKISDSKNNNEIIWRDENNNIIILDNYKRIVRIKYRCQDVGDYIIKLIDEYLEEKKINESNGL